MNRLSMPEFLADWPLKGRLRRMALLAAFASGAPLRLFVAGDALAVEGVHAARKRGVASGAGNEKRLVQPRRGGGRPGLSQARFRREGLVAGLAAFGPGFEKLAVAGLAPDMAGIPDGFVGHGIRSGGMAVAAALRLDVHGPAAFVLDPRFMVADGAVAHIFPVVLVVPVFGKALDLRVVAPDAGVIAAVGAVELLVFFDEIGLFRHAVARLAGQNIGRWRIFDARGRHLELMVADGAVGIAIGAARGAVRLVRKDNPASAVLHEYTRGNGFRRFREQVSRESRQKQNTAGNYHGNCALVQEASSRNKAVLSPPARPNGAESPLSVGSVRSGPVRPGGDKGGARAAAVNARKYVIEAMPLRHLISGNTPLTGGVMAETPG